MQNRNYNEKLIWLVNPYGPIPGESWRDYRFTFLGKELSSKSFRVIWFTSNYSHHFKEKRSCSWKDIEINEKFLIKLIPSYSYKKNIGFGRILFHITYFINILREIQNSSEKPDLIIGVDSPQLIGLLANLIKKKYSIPLIIDIFDQWPELFKLTLPKSIRFLHPVIFAPLFYIRNLIYISADGIVSLCKSYLKDALKILNERNKNIPTSVFYNGIDLDQFIFSSGKKTNNEKLPKKSSYMKWLIYAGSLGNNYDIKTLLNAIKDLEKRNNLFFIIAGSGPFKEYLERFIFENKLENVRFLGKIPHDALILLYKNCDLALSCYDELSNVGMPDKSYDYISAGLPIINSLSGEFSKFIIDNQLGVNYQAGNIKSLISSIDRLSTNDNLINIMKKNCKKIAVKLDRKVQYSDYANYIADFFN